MTRSLPLLLCVATLAVGCRRDQPEATTPTSRVVTDTTNATRPKLTVAPTLAGPTVLDAQPFDLTKLRGQVVLVNFWATWCGPCKSEMPDLVALDRELAGEGYRTVGVAVNDDPATVKRYLTANGISYPVLYDHGDSVATAYGEALGEPMAGIPTTVFVNRRGEIAGSVVGSLTKAEFLAKLRPLLDEPAEVAM